MTTINTMHDLHRILVEHPEWRSELRNVLLTEELLALPQRFAEYTKATDKRLDRIEKDVHQLKNDVGELKGVGLENKLYNRGIGLTATYLDLYDGERIRVAERDDNSAEFNSAIYGAREEGSLTTVEYRRLLATDMVIKGRKTGAAHPVYAAIEATFSISTRDIDKVCQSATLIRRILPDSEVHPMLYYMTPNASLERQATERGVTLMMTSTLT